eukprot:gene10036-biopygen10220
MSMRGDPPRSSAGIHPPPQQLVDACWLAWLLLSIGLVSKELASSGMSWGGPRSPGAGEVAELDDKRLRPGGVVDVQLGDEEGAVDPVRVPAEGGGGSKLFVGREMGQWAGSPNSGIFPSSGAGAPSLLRCGVRMGSEANRIASRRIASQSPS